MTSTEKKLLEALAWMTCQYLEQTDGSLDHLSMSAGERAISALSDFGLVIDKGRKSEWTEKGQKLLNESQ